MTATALRVARLVGAVLAVVFVLVLGLPALLGWVPLPIVDDDSTIPRGTLMVAEPVDPTHDVGSGDVVTILTDSGRLVTRDVAGVEGSTLTLSAGGESTVQVERERLRATERYGIPLLGHVAEAVPAAHRPWWGRGLGVLFLAWAAAEVWSALRARRSGAEGPAAIAAPSRRLKITRGPTRAGGARSTARAGRVRAAYAASDLTDDDDSATEGPQDAMPGVADGVAPAGAAFEDAGSEISGGVPGEALPTRRSRARARQRTPWDRVVEVAASAVGAVVLAARSVDRRHEDPVEDAEAESGGRHRSAAPATSVEPRRRSTRRRRAALATGATSRPEKASERAAVPPESVEAPPFEARPAGSPAEASRTGSTAASSGRHFWAQRASKEEVARAVRVQEFEAKRAAAETAMKLETDDADLSPIDRLIAEREAGSGGKRPSRDE